MKYIYDIHRIMVEKKLILVYEGEFTQDITKSVLAMTEQNLNSIGEEQNTKKKVFNVMVECLQNICKHQDGSDRDDSKQAIFMIGKEDNVYHIASGNPILNDNIASLKDKLDKINALDKEGLKNLYKEMIKTTTISEKGGAGLGFIDIARKSGNKLEYNFERIDNVTSFFSFKTRISRISE